MTTATAIDPSRAAKGFHALSDPTRLGIVMRLTRRTLSELPFRLDIRAQGGHAAGPTLALVHGAPVLNTVYWTEDRPDDFGFITPEDGSKDCFVHHSAIQGAPWALSSRPTLPGKTQAGGEPPARPRLDLSIKVDV